MPGLDSTSIAREAGRPDERPSTALVATAAAAFARAFASRIEAPLDGILPPGADPAAERVGSSARNPGRRSRTPDARCPR